MDYPADFHDAHLRHWEDGELLFKHDRWANADQLYGLSAECGLKAVMRCSGMPVGQYGVPTQRKHRQHVNLLWREFRTFVSGRIGGQYLNSLPAGDPFASWSIEDRYAHRGHFDNARVRPHRSAADGIRKMVQRARRDRGYEGSVRIV